MTALTIVLMALVVIGCIIIYTGVIVRAGVLFLRSLFDPILYGEGDEDDAADDDRDGAPNET